MPKTSFNTKFTYQSLKMSSVMDRLRDFAAGRVRWNSTCSLSQYMYLINQVWPGVWQAVHSAFSLSVAMPTRDGGRCQTLNSTSSAGVIGKDHHYLLDLLALTSMPFYLNYLSVYLSLLYLNYLIIRCKINI